MSETGQASGAARAGEAVTCCGIVLAAGRSERMGGRTKALLTLRGGGGRDETFAARAVRLLREGGIDRVVVVANPETRDAIAAASAPEARVAVNGRPEDGMVSSIRVALRAVEEEGFQVARAIVTLVDIPEISATVIRALRDAAAPADAWMTIPVFTDGRGHPLALHRAVFAALEGDLPRGLKTLMERAPERIHELKVAGSQPWDVDTPEDYRRYHS